MASNHLTLDKKANTQILENKGFPFDTLAKFFEAKKEKNTTTF